MAATTLPALFSLGDSILGLLQAGKQKRLINKIEAEGPSRYVPGALKESAAIAQAEANASASPVFSRALAEINTNTTNTLSNIERSTTDPALAASAAAAAGESANQAVLDLEAQNLGYRTDAQSNLQTVNSQIAQVQDQNKRIHNATLASLRGARDQNVFNAISKAFDVGAYFTYKPGSLNPQS